MKRISFVLMLLLSQVFAQYGTTNNYGNYSLTELNTYYLKTRPGQIETSPNYLTVIEFESLITNVATGRADILNIEVTDNTLLIKPTRSSGQTDLIVFIEGNTLLFTVSIDNANVPRRYTVTAKTSSTLNTTRSVDSNSSRLVNAASITQGNDNPSVPTQSSTNSNLPTITPTTIPSNPPTATHIPTQSNSPYAGTTLSTITDLQYPLAPQWLKKNMTIIRNGNELVINYAIINDGNNQLVLDPAQLRLTTSGNQFIYTQTSLGSPPNSNLAAGKTEYGVILLIGVPEGTNIILQWPLTELGTENTWLVQESFN